MASKKKRTVKNRSAKPPVKKPAPVEKKVPEIAKVEATIAHSETVVVVEQPKEIKTEQKIPVETTLETVTSPTETTGFKEIKQEEKVTGQKNEDPVVSENETAPVSVEDTIAVVEESNTLRWILILVILFLVGLLGGLFYFFWFQNKPTTQPKSDLTTVSVSSPTPTLPAADKSKVSIKVLNGSGTAGKAANGRDFLKGKGYTVTDVGNADKSSYTKTVIEAKDTVGKAFLDELRTDLGNNYTVSDQTTSLNSSQTSDVVVIIGSETK